MTSNRRKFTIGLIVASPDAKEVKMYLQFPDHARSLFPRMPKHITDIQACLSVDSTQARVILALCGQAKPAYRAILLNDIAMALESGVTIKQIATWGKTIARQVPMWQAGHGQR